MGGRRYRENQGRWCIEPSRFVSKKKGKKKGEKARKREREKSKRKKEGRKICLAAFCTWRFFIGANPLVFQVQPPSSCAGSFSLFYSSVRRCVASYVLPLGSHSVPLALFWIKVPTLVRPQTRYRGLCRLGRAVSSILPTHKPGFLLFFSIPTALLLHSDRVSEFYFIRDRKRIVNSIYKKKTCIPVIDFCLLPAGPDYIRKGTYISSRFSCIFIFVGRLFRLFDPVDLIGI